MERLFNSFATLTFPDSFPRGKISATGKIYTGNGSKKNEKNEEKKENKMRLKRKQLVITSDKVQDSNVQEQ
jgi:hypothetical protein